MFCEFCLLECINNSDPDRLELFKKIPAKSNLFVSANYIVKTAERCNIIYSDAIATWYLIEYVMHVFMNILKLFVAKHLNERRECFLSCILFNDDSHDALERTSCGFIWVCLWMRSISLAAIVRRWSLWHVRKLETMTRRWRRLCEIQTFTI